MQKTLRFFSCGHCHSLSLLKGPAPMWVQLKTSDASADVDWLGSCGRRFVSPVSPEKNQDLPWSMGDLTVCGCIHVVESQSSMTFSKMVCVFSQLWEFTGFGWFWNHMNFLDRIWPLCSATHSRVCMNFPWWSTPTGMPGCEIVTSRKICMLMHVEDCWSSFVHF